MEKCPPLILSSRRQKMEGESKSGLGEDQQVGRAGAALVVSHQHMKSQLPSIPTNALVLMFPIMPS